MSPAPSRTSGLPSKREPQGLLPRGISSTQSSAKNDMMRSRSCALKASQSAVSVDREDPSGASSSVVRVLSRRCRHASAAGRAASRRAASAWRPRRSSSPTRAGRPASRPSGGRARATAGCAPGVLPRCVSSAGYMAMYCAMRTRLPEWFGRTPCARRLLKIRRSPGSISTLTIFRPVDVRHHRIAVGGLGLHPFLEIVEKLGDALEAADRVVLLHQAEHALHAHRRRVERWCRHPSG